MDLPMHGWARSLLKLEVLVCFLPCAFVLMAGAATVPLSLLHFLRQPLSPESPPQLLLILTVVCGTIGLCTLLYVVSVLFDGKESIESPVCVSGGILLGAAPLIVLFALSIADAPKIQWWIAATTGLPLLATAHILYLSRQLFITGSKNRKRK